MVCYLVGLYIFSASHIAWNFFNCIFLGFNEKHTKKFNRNFWLFWWETNPFEFCKWVFDYRFLSAGIFWALIRMLCPRIEEIFVLFMILRWEHGTPRMVLLHSLSSLPPCHSSWISLSLLFFCYMWTDRPTMYEVSHSRTVILANSRTTTAAATNPTAKKTN